MGVDKINDEIPRAKYRWDLRSSRLEPSMSINLSSRKKEANYAGTALVHGRTCQDVVDVVGTKDFFLAVCDPFHRAESDSALLDKR